MSLELLDAEYDFWVVVTIKSLIQGVFPQAMEDFRLGPIIYEQIKGIFGLGFCVSDKNPPLRGQEGHQIGLRAMLQVNQGEGD